MNENEMSQELECLMDGMGQEQARYPLGNQTFEEIITAGKYYVDKTALVFRMTHTYKYVFLRRVRAQIHPVGLNRVSTFLKIEVAADAVRNRQIRFERGRESGYRPHQPLRMETPLFPVRQTALAVFQRAGHARLAVAFQHGQVDEKRGVQRTAADFHRAERRFHCPRPVFLRS